MKNLLRFGFACAAIVTVAAVSAQNIVGTWTGHIDTSHMVFKNDQEKKSMAMVMPMFKTLKISAVLSKDHTYKLSMAGGPQGSQPHAETGKWSVSGHTFTMTDKKGKSAKGTVSADGRTISVNPPEGDGGPKGMRLILTK
jgi:hypothetical protein